MGYLTKLSAVMAGINKAVQAVTVFVVSHVFYCSVDTNQCFTAGKGLAMVLVVGGVLLFSFAKEMGAKKKAEQQATIDDVDGGDGFRISNASSYNKLLQAQSSTVLLVVPSSSCN